MVYRILAIAALLVVGVSMLGCGMGEPPPFDPKNIEQIQKEQTQFVPTPEMRPLPTTLPAVEARPGSPTTMPFLRSTTQPLGPTVRLTLQHIIHMTAMNNLDVHVAGYDPAIRESQILEAESKFDPSIFSTLQASRQYQQGFPPSTQPNKLYQYEVDGPGIRWQAPSGGEFRIFPKVTQYDFPQTFAFPPGNGKVWDTQLVVAITQPLLQNFGAEVNLARVYIARNDQKIAELDFRDQLEKTLQQTEETYWQLVLRQRDVEIQELLLQETENTLDILIKRGKQDVTLVQISQARATLEQRNVVLVAARGRVRDLSDQLKLFMHDPALPVGGPQIIMPADRPLEVPIRFALADQVETALRNRLELLKAKLQIDSARIIIHAAKNNELPKLDASFQIGFEGLDNTFTGAIDNADDGKLINYTIGLQFEVPIGNRGARAITQRTLLQYYQAIDQFRSAAEHAVLDVKVAQNAVFTAWEQIIAARQARFAAEDALTAIEVRERAGEPLTPTFVQLKLDRQSALAETQRAEVNAITDYNTALAGLEKAKGTILRYNNVVMKEAKGPMYSRVAVQGK